jgi:hypothetical protein
VAAHISARPPLQNIDERRFVFEQSASGIPGTIADLRWFGKELDVILVLTEKSELMRSTDDGKTFQSVRCAEAQ